MPTLNLCLGALSAMSAMFHLSAEFRYPSYRSIFDQTKTFRVAAGKKAVVSPRVS